MLTMSAPEQTQREYLDVKEVARLLGYSVASIYRLVDEGVIPKDQIGKHRRIMIPRRDLKRKFPNLMPD